MTASAVSAGQRVSRTRPCEICSGYPDLPQGRGVRCYGFLSSDRAWAHCTRPELAGPIPQGKDDAFSHRLRGRCLCGAEHGSRDFVAPPSRPANAANPAKDVSEVVRRILAGTRAPAGTPVEAYLASRRLQAPYPPALRFAPSLLHAPTGRYLPAMVSVVTRWPMLEPVAIHRTFLDPTGDSKAAVDHNKMMLGPVAGAAVRLSAPADRMAVSEGIETGLSVQRATGMATWAALSAVGIECLTLPPLPLGSTVVIAADNDARGLHAAHRAADRWLAEGRRVRIATPPAGFGDFNDSWRAEVGQ